MSNGLKMTGATHSGSDSIIYATIEESLGQSRPVSQTYNVGITTAVVETTTETVVDTPPTTIVTEQTTPTTTMDTSTTDTTPSTDTSTGNDTGSSGSGGYGY